MLHRARSTLAATAAPPNERLIDRFSWFKANDAPGNDTPTGNTPSSRSSYSASTTQTQSNYRRTGSGHSLNERQLLPLILLVSVMLRVLAAFWQGNSVRTLPGVAQQLSYDELAWRVSRGLGFTFELAHWPATAAGAPTAFWSFLYTSFLALIYLPFGWQPLLARLIQAVIVGLLHPWLVWRISQRIFPVWIGVLAAAWSAIYLYFCYYSGALLPDAFLVVALLWVIDVAQRLRADLAAGKRRWLELGLALAVAILLHQTVLLIVPLLVGWLWRAGIVHQAQDSAYQLRSTHYGLRMARRAPLAAARGGMARFFPWPVIGGLLSSALLLLLAIAPWSVRNYLAFDTFLPLNSGAGFTLYLTNHPQADLHALAATGGDEQLSRALIPPQLSTLNEAALDRELQGLGFEFVARDPVGYVTSAFGKFGKFFKFWPSTELGLLDNLARLLSFAISLPFILYGLWSIALFDWPRLARGQRAELGLILWFVIWYALLHALTWAQIAQRLPVDALLLIVAAVGLDRAVQNYRGLYHGDQRANDRTRYRSRQVSISSGNGPRTNRIE